MDLVKTMYKQEMQITCITDFTNTNIKKTTKYTTKCMKQVWIEVRIKRTVNVCL